MVLRVIPLEGKRNKNKTSVKTIILRLECILKLNLYEETFIRVYRNPYTVSWNISERFL